ncbi:jg6204, partial [Pararge aegeria aegeria]
STVADSHLRRSPRLRGDGATTWGEEVKSTKGSQSYEGSVRHFGVVGRLLDFWLRPYASVTVDRNHVQVTTEIGASSDLSR